MNILKKAALALGGVVAVTSLVIWPQTQPASAATTQAAVVHVNWGSQPKSNPVFVRDRIKGIRAPKYSYFDRLSLDMDGTAVPGYYARYVTRCIADGSGVPLPMRTGTVIQIGVKANSRLAARADALNVSGYPVFRQVRTQGSFEGYTQVCIATRARLPFRLVKTSSTAPDHHGILAIDVARNW